MDFTKLDLLQKNTQKEVNLYVGQGLMYITVFMTCLISQPIPMERHLFELSPTNESNEWPHFMVWLENNKVSIRIFSFLEIICCKYYTHPSRFSFQLYLNETKAIPNL